MLPQPGVVHVEDGLRFVGAPDLGLVLSRCSPYKVPPAWPVGVQPVSALQKSGSDGFTWLRAPASAVGQLDG